MTELRCDFDGEFPDDFFFRLGTLTRHQGWTVLGQMIRKTRHGWHVVVCVHEEISPVMVVAAQAILGSDWKRENFNLFRADRLHHLPAVWREACRWNALYTSHTHFNRRVPDGTDQGNGIKAEAAGKPVR